MSYVFQRVVIVSFLQSITRILAMLSFALSDNIHPLVLIGLLAKAGQYIFSHVTLFLPFLGALHSLGMYVICGKLLMVQSTFSLIIFFFPQLVYL